jgi:6,7-dimethyl-8-ribityllumazine synthase
MTHAPAAADVRVHTGTLDAAGLRVAIVAARFNETVVRSLVDGAVAALLRHRALAADIQVAWVPGAFELPVVLERLAASGEVDTLVALGCVIRGATPHFEHVAGECASGSSAVSRAHGLPVAFGVLTTDSAEQAIERAGGKLGNKGADAALAAVETARLLQQL